MFLPVYGFLKTYVMMVTNMKDYVTLDSDVDDADFRYGSSDVMIAQFQQGLYNKNNSLQSQCKGDEVDTLQNTIKIWLNTVDDTGGPIPDDIHKYDYYDEGLDHSVCGAKIFLQIRELKSFLNILRIK